jgi:ribosome biogenesis GTPase A
MPPKKTVVEKKALLGRPSNNLKIGIVGMPNVGKSSLFNVIAKCGRCDQFFVHHSTVSSFIPQAIIYIPS